MTSIVRLYVWVHFIPYYHWNKLYNFIQLDFPSFSHPIQ